LALFKKKKHVYQEKEAANIYQNTHFTPENVKEKIAKFILQLNNKTSLTLLDAGIGEGSIVTIPFIKEAVKKNIRLCIIGFDNSGEMLERLYKGLNSLIKNGEVHGNLKKFKEKNNLFLKAQFGDRGSVRVDVYKVDIESKEEFKKFEKKFEKQKADICLAFFFLHHLINWRLGLIKLLRMIKDNGYFIFAERLDDICILDGNLKNLDQLKKRDTSFIFYEFMEDFYQKRNDFFLWNPEISATNYTSVEKALSTFFNKTDELCERWKYFVKTENIYQWVEKGAYTYFWWGLPDNKRKELIEKYEKKFNNINIEIKDGLRVITFKIVENTKSVFQNFLLGDNLLASPILDKLSKRPSSCETIKFSEQRYKALKDLLALLSSHDIFTDRSLFAFLTYWTLQKEEKPEGTWISDMPLCIFRKNLNQEELHQALSLWIVYFANIEKLNFSVTNFIFKDLLEKPIIFVEGMKTQTNDFIEVIKDETNFPMRINIKLPNNLINWQELNKKIKNIKQKVKNYLDDLTHNGIHEIKGNMIIFKWSEVKRIYQDMGSERFLWNKLINLKNFEEFQRKIKKEIKEKLGCVLPESLEEQDIDNFIVVLALLSIVFSDYVTCMAYISSKILKEKGKNEGFGGMIIGEDLSKSSLDEGFFQTRCKLAQECINTKYSQFAVGEYSEKAAKETYKKVEEEIRGDMAATFSHAYVKRGDALFNIFRNICETNLSISIRDRDQGTYAKIKRGHNLSLTETIVTEYDLISDWYLYDMEIVRKVTTEDILKKFGNCKFENSTFLFNIVFRALSESVIIAKHCPEYENGFNNFFKDKLKKFKERVGDYSWLVRVIRFENAIRDKEWENEYQLLLDDLKNTSLIYLRLGQYEKLKIKIPREETDLYIKIWEKIFIEIFLNIIRNFGRGKRLIINLGKENDKYKLEFINPLDQNKKNEVKIYNSQKYIIPRSPREREGKGGWGLYGIYLFVDKILKAGHFEVRSDINKLQFHSRLLLNQNMFLEGVNFKWEKGGQF